MAATKKTEARWRALVREQESSGESVKEFARTRGLSAASLYWWRSVLGRRSRSKPKGIRFAQLTLQHSSEPAVHGAGIPAFELTLGSGHRLRVPSSFDPESLRRLLSVLEC